MAVLQELGLAGAKQPLPMQCAINLDNGLSVLISLLWTVFHSEVCFNHFYEWCFETLTEFVNSSYFKGLHSKVLFWGMCNNNTWSHNTNCLQVAIMTPEGSWGYPYIKISFQITHPAQNERLAKPPESMFPTLYERWCEVFSVVSLHLTRTRLEEVLWDGTVFSVWFFVLILED